MSNTLTSRLQPLPRRLSALALICFGCAAASARPEPIEIGSRLELFVDTLLIDRMNNVELELHEPVRQPLSEAPLPVRHMKTIIKDGDRYRAWWRSTNPDYTGPTHTGHPGETLEYAESADGINWTFPELGLVEIAGSTDNNVVLADLPPFLTNFAPFLDTRPGVPDEERYKALAGYPGSGDKRELRGEELTGKGLFAFVSPDGLNWTQKTEVIPYQPGWRHAFDSLNVVFWSPAEQKYVCYFRVWTQPERLRSIARTTSPDFMNWSEPVEMEPNLPGEHLYTNNTSPYFRAPHIYLAMPTRFIPDRGDAPNYDPKDVNSTDILFMTSRAGNDHYDRQFKGAFIRPGLDPDQWGNRANYTAQNIVPTGLNEISIYHRSGHRYTLRTDGFVSATAGFEQGELLTKPLVFDGDELVLNMSTTAAGDVRVEVQDRNGNPIPGFTLDDCTLIVGDRIEQTVRWTGGQNLGSLAGTPVRLRFVMKECDLYSFRFR